MTRGVVSAAVRLTSLLVTVLSLPGTADAFYSQREQAYKVYMSPWSQCQALPDEDQPPQYYKDRAADKAGASSRHVGHLRDFRHLDAGRALAPSRSLVHTPRLGFQRRSIECRDINGQVTNVEKCGPAYQSTATARTCIMRTDCMLGDWSTWRARPGGGYTRTRRVLALPHGDGAECGVVEEVRPLLPEPGAHWATGAWGRCHVAGVSILPIANIPNRVSPVGIVDPLLASQSPFTGGPCGGGAQRREVTCVRPDGRALHPAHCADLPSPALQQPCEVACPRDCVVGEWSEWSPCKPFGGCPMYPVQELTTAGYSTRKRRVLTAASDSGAPCPALQETRSCASPRCAAWSADAWSACTLFVPEDGCGPGLRTRELRCLDHDGKETPHSWCARGAGAATWSRGEHCFIACPGDCVLSAWGNWSSCSAPCSAPGQAQPTRTRRRHILAHSGTQEEGAYQCPKEDKLVQSEPCNTHSCSTHAWLTLPWESCRPLQRRAGVGVGAGLTDDIDEADSAVALKDAGVEATSCLIAGEKSREVSCVQDNERIVKDSLCSPLVKPVTRRSCSLPCPRACSAGPWSEWSTCPNTCEPAIQSRERTVWGGEECGARQERRMCTPPRTCSAAGIGNRASWSAGEWGACRLPPPLQCGFGRRVRGIWCTVDNHRVDASACAGLNAPPLADMQCRVPCDTDTGKNVTSSPCHEICSKRGVLATADWNINCICQNIHVELLLPESDCILPEGASCGVGKKLKSALCIDSAVRSVLPMDVCKRYNNLTTNRYTSLPEYTYDEEFPGLLARSCVEPCPRDCAAGPWSEWGPCILEEDSLAAFRTRTRTVLYAAENGGRECGPTLQRAACSRRELVWHASEWDVCTPLESSPCGHAVQNRTVSCILLDKGLKMDDAACGLEHKPHSQAECNAPCPADCVVSQWSDWSPCEQYKSGGRRDRTRVVLRSPTPDGAACPHLVEAEPCTARTYTWFVAPWDDCQPLGGSPCGEGTKRRIVRCMRDDGLFVNDSLCPTLVQNTTATEARTSWCYVPCGADCELTDWGAWDTSTCTCGIGRQFRTQYMIRRRRRVSGAAWPGRACGAEEQRVPCARTLCMRSVATPRIECQAEEPQYFLDTSPMYARPRLCGQGVLETVVTCEPFEPGDTLESDRKVEPPPGVRYELSRCATALPGRIVSAPAQSLREPCTVECGCTNPGASTSELGEWSAWGPCRAGVRSRTRHRVLLPRPRCPEPNKFVTIEWANCTVLSTTHVATMPQAPSAPEVVTAQTTTTHDSKFKIWFGYPTNNPEHNQHDKHANKTHFRSESSMAVSVTMWLAGGVILMYALYAPYLAYVRYRLSQKDKGVSQV